MELSEWARRILSGDTLEEKLLTPTQFTDQAPGEPIFWKEPTRPLQMAFQKHTRKNRLPSLHELNDPDKRGVCLHRFAGHELLAVEIMAYALLAFPQAPKHFRRGLAQTLAEEQIHVRLYLEQLQRLQLSLFDLPFYKHFWAYTPYLKTPEQYISVMSLTFEMANLDFAPAYGKAFAMAGDIESAQLMEQILKDELNHVSFGWAWLNKLKDPSLSSWQAWKSCLPEKLLITRAKGGCFEEENRIKAGVSQDFLTQFKAHLG